jgi:queuine tRNA-ribosyltransferase
MDFDGFGIGGSFSKEDMMGALQAAVKHLPEEKPRHFLGIGEPGDLLLGIAEGMDTFDCVAATRLGRHGSIYTPKGIVHLKSEKYRSDYTPLLADQLRSTPGVEQVLGGFSRAYVAHMLRSGEMLGQMLASMHNLAFIIALVDGAREALQGGRFEQYREDFIREYYA